ncbi:MAG: hypothetical protein PHD79_03505 [Aliarcobacter sp.]|nr:hypothetical protein [Aliarcobacter sp.]
MDIYKIPSNTYTVHGNTKKELTLDEKDILTKSIELINENNKDILMLYRGIKMKYQLSRLNCNSIFDVFDKLFMVGDKASNFYNDIAKLDNKNELRRNYLLDINDISDDTFNFIYNTINDEILDENTEFERYFENTTEREFLEVIQSINPRDKLSIRDYYYAYLHTMGTSVEKYSHYISTTVDHRIALDFSGDSEQLIFHFILTKPYLKFAVYSRNSGYFGRLCKKYNLPTYKARYSDENEISIKGGLLPHFIFGIEYISKDKKSEFIVNPYLFKENYNINEITTKGFPINQEYFMDVINSTNYNRFAVVYNDGNIIKQFDTK